MARASATVGRWGSARGAADQELPARQSAAGAPRRRGQQASLHLAAAAYTAGAELPTAVCAHSTGSPVAYETVVRLARRAPGRTVPGHLSVSGAAAPREDREDLPAIDDESPIAFTRRPGGAGPGVHEIPELRDLLLPSLRADIRLLTDHRPTLAPVRLDVPVTAFWRRPGRPLPARVPVDVGGAHTGRRESSPA